MEEKKFNHIVIVDENTKITLSIAEVLTAMDLRGLSLKAKKLCEISEIVSKPKEKTTRPYNKSGAYSKKENRGKKLWSDESISVLKKALANGEGRDKKDIYEEVSRKVGLTPKQVYDKDHNMRNANR